MQAESQQKQPEGLYYQIVAGLRSLMSRILEPHLDPKIFLSEVAAAAKQLSPDDLEARVYEVDFIENRLYLRTSTRLDVNQLPEKERTFTILPQTITGDAIIENRTIVATRLEGYASSRFHEGQELRAAFPIEFYDVEMPEGRTKYVLVVDKKGPGALGADVLEALRDYSTLAGLAISIKELRDKLSQYYEQNRNLVLTGRHSAAIGHDIRSLNVGVGGYLKMALKLLADPKAEDLAATTSKYVGLAKDNATQVEALLKNFAQFNRTSIVLNRDTELVEAVRVKINSLQHRQDFGRRLVFALDLPDRPTGILVDADWFGTVLENLVKNSVEACRGETRIGLRIKNADDRVVLTFEDNCGGIPLESIPDVFRPFASGKKAGQGLGLANAKKVVEDHGGVISVTNQDGWGAVFTMEFNRKNG